MSIIDLAGLSPERRQGLLSQLVVPRPIAMVTTVDRSGAVNVAPFSYFMPLTGEPPLLAITIGGARAADGLPKHTWLNIEATGELVVNLTTRALAPHIETVAREYPPGSGELDATGWRCRPSHVVAPPSLVESPAQMECRVTEVIERGQRADGTAVFRIVLVEVVCVDVDDALQTSPGRIDPTRVDAVGRLGFPWFVVATAESMFPLERVPYQA
ncbi:flavin reductase family protein [Micromonospora sp. NPDC049900]|uniref:flavin reductase family protein n=1 Tax=unclassified Micromonospora TaxID=2617518 RepID=UPI00379E96B8